MTAPTPDLLRIQRLRERFLRGGSGRGIADYWRDRADVEAYDAVLGARIGWKWQAVLNECRARGFAPPADAVVLDHGCGSGVAARRYVEAFGAGEVLCHDRSQHAVRYAVEALAGAGHAARAVDRVDELAPDVLLVSHVLSELDARGEARLEELVRRSRFALLVESGNRPVARRLSALRDRLVAAEGAGLVALAPCPHQAACPTLAAGREQDWCHFFASPPPEVFTDGNWVRTAKALGIDLRSLPYAFVLLARREVAAAAAPDAVRWLGRAQVATRDALLTGCRADGLVERTVTRRHDAALWRQLKKRPADLRELRLGAPD